MKAIAKLTTDAGWKPTVVLKPNTDLKSLVNYMAGGCVESGG